MKNIFLLLLIAASIGVFVVFVRPRYSEVKSIRKEIESFSTNLSTANKLEQSRVALIAKYNSISKADLDGIKTLLPDSVDNIRLIIQINALANKNGLSVLRNVDYKTDQDKGATGVASPEVAKKPYGEFTITFQTSGQYKNFLSFLSDLEQNLRLIDVTSVDFAANEPNQANPLLTNYLTYKITLKTYWLKQ